MFSPQALAGLNTTYTAQRVSAQEARAWAHTQGRQYTLDVVEEQVASGEQLYLVDGDILTERQMDEQYLSCDSCGKLVWVEPLTCGVTQYQENAGDIVCNPCYADRLRQALTSSAQPFNGWPAQGLLTPEQFRHALDERVVEDALLAAGWEKIEEGGGDAMTPSSHEYGGDSLEDTCRRFADYVADHPDQQFFVTRVVWQFAADATLWGRSR